MADKTNSKSKLKRIPYTETYKVEVENVTLTAWITFRAKDGLDAVKVFGDMSDRTLIRKINDNLGSIRVKKIGDALVVRMAAEEVK